MNLANKVKEPGGILYWVMAGGEIRKSVQNYQNFKFLDADGSPSFTVAAESMLVRYSNISYSSQAPFS
jgi:hypothetical protein